MPPMARFYQDVYHYPAFFQQPQVPQDVPPHSRLYVGCSRTTTKDTLEKSFSEFGQVEQVKMVIDRASGQFKGSAFVKFSKASSAALALEALNEQDIKGEGQPLKVTFAEPRGSVPYDSSDPAEQPPRSRLFVTFPKEMAQEELENIFHRFGEIEAVKILFDKATEEPKGIAYVKFAKASSAALAVEQVAQEAANSMAARPVRCRVAEPRSQPPGSMLGMMAPPYLGFPPYPMYPLDPSLLAMQDYTQFPQYPPIPPGFLMGSGGSASARRSTAEQRRHDNNNPPGSRLFISFSKPLPADLLQAIFARYGPLETVYLVKGKNYGYAKYATAQAAQVAMHHLNQKLVEGAACRISVAEPQRPSVAKP